MDPGGHDTHETAAAPATVPTEQGSQSAAPLMPINRHARQVSHDDALVKLALERPALWERVLEAPLGAHMPPDSQRPPA